MKHFKNIATSTNEVYDVKILRKIFCWKFDLNNTVENLHNFKWNPLHVAI